MRKQHAREKRKKIQEKENPLLEKINAGCIWRENAFSYIRNEVA